MINSREQLALIVYPIVFQYLFNLILNVGVDFADITSWSKLFQKLIIIELKMLSYG